MPILIRDAAADSHPVIGIASLCSPTMQIKVRDDSLGWSSKRFIERFKENPEERFARWLERSTTDAIDEIYKADLIRDGLLSPDLQAPNLQKLLKDAGANREAYQRDGDSNRLKSIPPESLTDSQWRDRAESPLFRWKRCETLVQLLKVRDILAPHFENKHYQRGLEELLASSKGRKAITSVLRRVRGERIGVTMADINVCGAVPPYSSLLGGKLVTMLLTSPEVVRAYERRYSGAVIVISSAMAGRQVKRPPKLALLGTTSLYGVSSSQYNRVKIPCAEVGGPIGEQIRYAELGRTEGFGSSHISDGSLKAMANLLKHTSNGREVQSNFGEGASPRLRKVREGLDLLSFPSEDLLNHGSPRLVYGAALVRNLEDYLVGLQVDPDYLLPFDDPKGSTELIADWWRRRWLSMRIKNKDVIKDVTSHSLSYPITHGARVVLPAERSDQNSLFEDLENFY